LYCPSSPIVLSSCCSIVSVVFIAVDERRTKRLVQGKYGLQVLQVKTKKDKEEEQMKKEEAVCTSEFDVLQTAVFFFLQLSYGVCVCELGEKEREGKKRIKKSFTGKEEEEN
jgi:cytochrome oxidase Cu insertion factor (SCO1/SenC/PrrC family)